MTNLQNSFKRLVKIYVTYDEKEWEDLERKSKEFALNVVGCDLAPTVRLKILEALKIEFKFSDKWERRAIEKMLKDVARLVGCYDDWLFGCIESHDAHSARCAVLTKW